MRYPGPFHNCCIPANNLQIFSGQAAEEISNGDLYFVTLVLKIAVTGVFLEVKISSI